jgi:hypothetical protein
MKNVCIILAAVVGATCMAHAGTIEITEQATARGSLDGTSFTNVAITLAFFGDTTLVAGNSTEWTLNGAASVAVAGLGSDTFTDTIQAYSIPGSGEVGLQDGSNVILQASTFSLDGYGLTTAIGPVTGSASLSGATFTTSGGTFHISAITVVGDSQTSTVTATLPSSQTPEPGSFLLAAAGMAGLGLYRRTKRS